MPGQHIHMAPPVLPRDRIAAALAEYEVQRLPDRALHDLLPDLKGRRHHIPAAQAVISRFLHLAEIQHGKPPSAGVHPPGGFPQNRPSLFVQQGKCLLARARDGRLLSQAMISGHGVRHPPGLAVPAPLLPRALHPLQLERREREAKLLPRGGIAPVRVHGHRKGRDPVPGEGVELPDHLVPFMVHQVGQVLPLPAVGVRHGPAALIADMHPQVHAVAPHGIRLHPYAYTIVVLPALPRQGESQDTAKLRRRGPVLIGQRIPGRGRGDADGVPAALAPALFYLHGADA